MAAAADFWTTLASWLPSNQEVVKDVIKWLAVAGISVAATWASVRFRDWWKRRKGSADCWERLERARSAVRGQSGVWLTPPRTYPENYKLRLNGSIPILTLANLKGGVGKTTIAANLAGAFALSGEKILLIDLDFQGSLSSMMLGAEAGKARPAANELSAASEALLGEKTANWLVARARPSPVLANIFTVPSFYDLARAENQLLIEWLIKDRPHDMPYFLSKLLLSDEVQRTYDRVLIDAPPRMSAACVQALCASTHLLIPTIMDQTSTEGVTTFINEVNELRANGLCPQIEYLGIVGSMLPSGTTRYYEPAVKNLTDEIRVKKLQVDLLPETTWIKELPAIGRAAGLTLGIAEGESKDRKAIADAFAPLVGEIRRRAPARVKA